MVAAALIIESLHRSTTVVFSIIRQRRMHKQIGSIALDAILEEPNK